MLSGLSPLLILALGILLGLYVVPKVRAKVGV